MQNVCVCVCVWGGGEERESVQGERVCERAGLSEQVMHDLCTIYINRVFSFSFFPLKNTSQGAYFEFETGSVSFQFVRSFVRSFVCWDHWPF